MIRKRKLLAPVALAAVGITVLAVSAATASTKSTINISIPGATRSAAPLVVSVAKPPAGTTFGIVTPLHADPGQAAMDTANARIASLVGAKSVMEDSALDASKQLQIADSMLSRGFKPIATDIIFPHSMDAFLKRPPRAVRRRTTRWLARRSRRTCTSCSPTARRVRSWRTRRPPSSSTVRPASQQR